MLEEKNDKKNVDHKKLGRELGLFSFSRKVPGVAYWWPKGNQLFNTIVDDLKKSLDEMGYQDIKTPMIISVDTLKKSGHFENYREKLFFTGNESDLKGDAKWCLKPMNCPGSIMIFNEEIRSYKDLPLRFSEVGTVYRYEQAGEVNGLLRARALTIDDAHIYCIEDQIKDEIMVLIEFIKKTYEKYGFKDLKVELSTRPEKSIGTDEQWKKAEDGLISTLDAKGVEYTENKGDGAFYGPKIDFHVSDALERSWQLGTIQLDFSMAERLEAKYIDAEGKEQTPVIIHRAILGSVERFIAILVESTRGVFPTWLAPVQAKVLPISDKHVDYATEVVKKLKDKGVRVEADERTESIGKKIREAEMQKIPYMLVVGDKEVEVKKVAVRKYGEGDKGQKSIEETSKEILG